MGSWPPNVGILAVELTFPKQYVDQTELEQFDGVSAGKYTVGLGQARMGFCTDREDIHSLCLTVVSKLMDKHKIPYERIGYLAVGTETLLDKSKSVKTVLMQLFPGASDGSAASDVEGIDSTNACYGGTAALFGALDWLESSAWDGRLALAVAGDIAVYAQGAARPTGGAGAVALLLGPGAPLTVDRGLRASCMRHVYDFYKPDLSSEYPTVDGKLSIQCYLGALDRCYRLYCEKRRAREGKKVTLDDLDAVLFHAPYCKLVQKALARLVLNDFLRENEPEQQQATSSSSNTSPGSVVVNGNGTHDENDVNDVDKKYESVARFAGVKLEDTYFDRDVEKAFMELSRDAFEKKTKPSLLLANQVGNMYTPSVYAALVSLLATAPSPAHLVGRRIALFSYGSGLAASMYSLTVTDSEEHLRGLLAGVADIRPMLDARVRVAPESFAKEMLRREEYGHRAPMVPTDDVGRLFPGSYYLEKVDDLHRRTYRRVDSGDAEK